MTDRDAETLVHKATTFADDLTERIGRIVPLDTPLSATILVGRAGDSRVTVAPYRSGEIVALPLAIDGVRRLDLHVKLNCCWDSARSFLAVEESWFHVIPTGDRMPTPLFRYEYLRACRRSVPAAHLHVHAHRDEFAHALIAAEKGKARQRWRTGKPPRMAEFHFPLGGHRFRPCVEDVLNAVVVEFGVDRCDGWDAAVEEGREAWRRTQLRSAVRDCPEEARRALEELDAEAAAEGRTLCDNPARLRAY